MEEEGTEAGCGGTTGGATAAAAAGDGGATHRRLPSRLDAASICRPLPSGRGRSLGRGGGAGGRGAGAASGGGRAHGCHGRAGATASSFSPVPHPRGTTPGQAVGHCPSTARPAGLCLPPPAPLVPTLSTTSHTDSLCRAMPSLSLAGPSGPWHAPEPAPASGAGTPTAAGGGGAGSGGSGEAVVLGDQQAPEVAGTGAVDIALGSQGPQATAAAAGLAAAAWATALDGLDMDLFNHWTPSCCWDLGEGDVGGGGHSSDAPHGHGNFGTPFISVRTALCALCSGVAVKATLGLERCRLVLCRVAVPCADSSLLSHDACDRCWLCKPCCTRACFVAGLLAPHPHTPPPVLPCPHPCVVVAVAGRCPRPHG